MADETQQPTEIPLGPMAQTLGELYATWQGAQAAAQAAANAAAAARARYEDSATFFARVSAVDPATVARFDFVKGVAVLKGAPE